MHNNIRITKIQWANNDLANCCTVYSKPVNCLPYFRIQYLVTFSSLYDELLDVSCGPVISCQGFGVLTLNMVCRRIHGIVQQNVGDGCDTSGLVSHLPQKSEALNYNSSRTNSQLCPRTNVKLIYDFNHGYG